MHSPLCATCFSPDVPNLTSWTSNALTSSLATVHWIELVDPSSQTVFVVGILILKYAGERHSQKYDARLNENWVGEHGWGN